MERAIEGRNRAQDRLRDSGDPGRPVADLHSPVTWAARTPSFVDLAS